MLTLTLSYVVLTASVFPPMPSISTSLSSTSSGEAVVEGGGSNTDSKAEEPPFFDFFEGGEREEGIGRCSVWVEGTIIVRM